MRATVRLTSVRAIGAICCTLWVFESPQDIAAAAPSYARIAAILDTYSSGKYVDALRDLTTLPDYPALVSGFRKEAPKWISAAGADKKESRSKAAGVVALEIARLGFAGERMHFQQFEDALRALEFGCDLMRHGQPDGFQHTWHLASVALIHGAQNYYSASSGDLLIVLEHLRHAQKAFPADGRFRLAELLMRPEARRMPNRPGTSAFSMTNGDIENIKEPENTQRVQKAIEDYGKLIDGAGIAAEARLRRGILLFHRTDFVGAMSDLHIAIESSQDPFITHTAHFYRALTLDAVGQRREAILALEEALRIVPHARSAAFLLAQDLFTSGRRAEAAELLQATLGSPALHDPWLELSAGDYRFWPDHLQQLRKEISP